MAVGLWRAVVVHFTDGSRLSVKPLGAGATSVAMGGQMPGMAQGGSSAASRSRGSACASCKRLYGRWVALVAGRAMNLSLLEERLEHRFSNRALLEQALTHRSHSSRHNERLEFLGDSVLNCAVASLLYEKFTRIDEGDLSRLRANLVKQSALAEIAQRLGLAQFLRLGEGELKSGGFRRPSILADALEAVFGAVYLDAGFEAACRVIQRQYVQLLAGVDPKTLGKDAKTLLQEYLQGRRIALPLYSVIATHGAAHNQEFEVECFIEKLDIRVTGRGTSRRAAEQNAARQALDLVEATKSSGGKGTAANDGGGNSASGRRGRARKAQLALPVAVPQRAGRTRASEQKS